MISISDGSNIPYHVRRLQEEFRKLKIDFQLITITLVYTHLFKPEEFTLYLGNREIVDGKITVENVCFESTMFGFTLPSGCSRLEFSNSIAPPNMANFFLGKSISNLDLTGLDMSRVINMSCCFQGSSGTEVKLTPSSQPFGCISIAWLFQGSKYGKITVKIPFANIVDAAYAFSSCAATEINFESSGYSHYYDHLTNCNYMFYNSKNITSLDLSNIRIIGSQYIGFLQSCTSLKTAIINNAITSQFSIASNLALKDTSSLEKLYISPTMIVLNSGTVKFRGELDFNNDYAKTYKSAILGDNNIYTITFKE